MKIMGAIFDCDGTLIDSLGFWELFYKRIGELYFGGKEFFPDPEDDRTMRTQNIAFLAHLMHEKYGIAESADEIANLCVHFFEWYYGEIVELKPGARELLSHLAGKGIKMCIASAAEKVLIELVLSRHDVLKYFDGIISCSDIGAGKDRPDVFLAAEKFLGTSHGETFVFEDSLLAIRTAKNAGFPVVGIYDALSFGQDAARELCDVYIENGGSFAELIPLIP